MHGSAATPGADVPAVELTQVSRYFGRTVAIEDVSFAVGKGEFFSIIGPSGSGKTTAIRMMAGLEVPTQGSIHLFGDDVTNVPPYERDTPMVFQSYALFPHLSVEDNVAYGLRMRGVGKDERRRRARDMLRLVGMTGYGDRRIDQLSGGQQQRVALARALVTEPRVVLLDEALGALDAALRVEMQSELKRLQEALGCTFVHVTHDQSEALAMADRILVLHAGKVEQIGTPSEVFARPGTRFVANFVGKNNLLDGTVTDATGADRGQVTIATDVGEVVAPCPEGSFFSDRQRVTLVIRADAMYRIRGDEKTPNAFTARVVGSEYEGARVTMRIEAAADLVFHLEEHESLTAGDPLQPGDEIRVGWEPADAFVMN